METNEVFCFTFQRIKVNATVDKRKDKRRLCLHFPETLTFGILCSNSCQSIGINCVCSYMSSLMLMKPANVNNLACCNRYRKEKIVPCFWSLCAFINM